MNAWAQTPETSAAQGLAHCNQCGACCRRNPCLLKPADVARLNQHVGPVHEYTALERTAAGRWQIRMRRPCRFLVENRCSIQEHKPSGGRDFECWTPDTRNYFWSPAELRRHLRIDVDAVLQGIR